MSNIKSIILAGVIVKHDGNYYGSAAASADLAATVAAAMAPIDRTYAYTNDGDEIAVYALPEGWDDHMVDGTRVDVVDRVEAGRFLGTVGSFSRQDPHGVEREKALRDALRVSVDLEDGHRVDVQIDPDFEINVEGGDRLLTMELRVAGTWFEGFKYLRASEWIDEDGVFEEQASHWSCNDVSEWRKAVPGLEFEEEAWDAIKKAIKASGIDLTASADEDELEDA